MKSYLSADRLRAALASFLAALSIILGGGSAVAQDAGAVVVRFTEVLGEIGGADPGPSLQIYDDGRVVVHYPHYMKRAGEYALQLSQSEMDRLLRSLINKGVLGFDETAARRSKQEAAAVQTELFAVSDASTTVIEVYLDRYQSIEQLGQETQNAQKKISWYGLRSDAKRYPHIEAIQNLAAARRELQALMQRPDLKKIQ